MQLYKNNGLPVGAAIGVPIGAVALAAALLYMAHLNRQRTSRYGFAEASAWVFLQETLT